MERAPEELLHRLVPGTQVGEWRVEAWQGQGAYGAVYRAVPMGQEHAGPVALKLSLYPWDARFVREAELLSRMSHPSIPRLLGRGVLRRPSGEEHPWFVMEWVEGTPLYAWAQQHAPSYRQVCLLLAQLARALEATHAAGAVHRDVKGDNVLVRHSDGRAMLIDFGSGHFQGAPRLTWHSLPPGTPAYQSAQAGLFHIRLARQRDGYYPPSPADDLYSLGVTAYRLLMGQYPPDMDVQQDEAGGWQVKSPEPRPLLENKPGVPPLLREWILRLLSDSPEARGTAAQLAEALEAAADEHVQRLRPASLPATGALPPNAPVPAVPAALPQRPRPLAGMRAWKPWLVLTAAGVTGMLLWSVLPVPRPPGRLSASTPHSSGSQAPDAGTAALGDTSPTEPLASARPPSEPESMAQEPPPEPRPGQARPDAKGRCPGRKQVAINGGCWVENPSMTAEECAESGYVLFKGRCYTHALAPPQKPLPTSNPAKAR
jgi:serine/threonine protein kinase